LNATQNPNYQVSLTEASVVMCRKGSLLLTMLKLIFLISPRLSLLWEEKWEKLSENGLGN